MFILDILCYRLPETYKVSKKCLRRERTTNISIQRLAALTILLERLTTESVTVAIFSS